ncbi:MAG: GGDEF domain-containing protein [Rhodoblastus sp.]|nr:GGDEF domain-containing protein [Rhodoblastus sp.]
MSQSSARAWTLQLVPPAMAGLALISSFTAASYLRDAIALRFPDVTVLAIPAYDFVVAFLLFTSGIFVTLAFQSLACGRPLLPHGIARALCAEEAEVSGERLHAHLGASLQALEAHTKSAGRFADSLSEGQSRLKMAEDAARVRSIAKFLAGENDKMQRANAAYQRQLTDATRQLNILRNELSRVRSENERDALTGAYSRGHFDKMLTTLVKAAHQDSSDLSLLMVDIDHFKRINDNFGHVVGDDLLQKYVQLMMHNVKGKDCLARYGGEEFAIIMPTTSLQSAVIVAEQIRQKLEATKWKAGKDGAMIGAVTASFGVAQLQPDETPHDLIERADQKLYASKNAGRNRVSR